MPSANEFEQRIEALLLFIGLGVELRVLDGDGSLVGKAAQQGLVVVGEGLPAYERKIKMMPTTFWRATIGSPNPVEQSQAGLLGDLVRASG